MRLFTGKAKDDECVKWLKTHCYKPFGTGKQIRDCDKKDCKCANGSWLKCDEMKKGNKC